MACSRATPAPARACSCLIPIEQAYAATQWVAETGATLGVDPSRLVLFGESVGGNMVAAVTLLAKERQGPQIRIQVLCYPMTDAGFDTASYGQYAEGPWLTRKAMEWFWDSSAPEVAVRTEPTASPLRASLAQLQGLPPALLIADENDVLRDEGEAYAHKLLAAGVPVTATRFLGTTHDFVLLNPIAQSLPTRAAIAQATVALRAALAGSGPLRRNANRPHAQGARLHRHVHPGPGRDPVVARQRPTRVLPWRRFHARLQRRAVPRRPAGDVDLYIKPTLFPGCFANGPPAACPRCSRASGAKRRHGPPYQFQGPY